MTHTKPTPATETDVDLERRIMDFILHDILEGDPGIDLTATDDLLLSGTLDSLGVLRLVEHIGRLTGEGVAPQDVTLENFQSVTAICSYLAQRPPGGSQ